MFVRGKLFKPKLTNILAYYDVADSGLSMKVQPAKIRGPGVVFTVPRHLA
jgi:hypothetical protein